MTTSTLFTPRDLTEREWASVLEQEFDAGWFPEHHRCSVATEDATVYVDFDATYLGGLTPDERRELTAQLGFLPKVALHVGANAYYPGSSRLAEIVAQTLCRRLDGRALVAA